MLAIVIDSTSGLTRSEAKELGVTVVPTYYSVDGHANEERFADECAGYEPQLGSDAMLHTEPAFPDAYLDAFSEALAKGDDVLCITLSSRLSAGHRSAEVARSMLLGTSALRYPSRSSVATSTRALPWPTCTCCAAVGASPTRVAP